MDTTRDMQNSVTWWPLSTHCRVPDTKALPLSWKNIGWRVLLAVVFSIDLVDAILDYIFAAKMLEAGKTGYAVMMIVATTVSVVAGLLLGRILEVRTMHGCLLRAADYTLTTLLYPNRTFALLTPHLPCPQLVIEWTDPAMDKMAGGKPRAPAMILVAVMGSE